MPYELSFTKSLAVENPDIYWNECCWGGDYVSERLLPMVRGGYEGVWHDQEDWGWFIWFHDGDTKLAVDVYCDDPKTGTFRIFLTSQVRRPLFGYRITDTDELFQLKTRVSKELESWVDGDIVETLLDKNHDPIEP
ncbi:MAG: hypothetical protein QNI96_10475 [Woeseiaceae bacterium]|nr:hypothetical protein [Woeseiaceae bacterium]